MHARVGGGVRAGLCVGVLLAAVLASPVPVAASAAPAASSKEPPRSTDTARPSRISRPGSLRIANSASTVTPGGAWSWQNPKPNGNSLFAISCVPGTTTCFAAGENGPILNTTDAGAHWTQQQNVTNIFGLSCSTAQSCTGVGANGLVVFTTNGGASWSTYQTGITLYSVWCPSSRCLAVGAGGRILQINGGSTVPVTSGTTASLFGIGCTPIRGFCVAVGAAGTVLESSDGGTSFFAGPNQTTATLNAVSCSESLCVAGGVNGVVVAGNPSNNLWMAGSLGESFPVDILGSSCQGAACWLSADDGLVYYGGGLAWTAADPLGPSALWSISCADQNFCMTAGDNGFISATTSNGTGWRQQSPNPGPKLTGISCANPSMCMAAGGHKVVVTTDTGQTWSDVTPTSFPAATFNSVSCPSAGVCYVVGTQNLSGNFPGSLVLATSDAGTSWSTADQTSFYPALKAVSCVAASQTCVAVGDGGLILFSGTGGWPAAISGTNSENFLSVTCVATTSCMTVGIFQGATTIYSSSDRVHWSPILTTSNNLGGITCSTTSTCYAVGSAFANMSILTTTNGGATWQQHAPVGTGDTLSAVSCEATTVCLAVGPSTDIWGTTDGVTWTLQLASPIAADTISCVPGTTCFAAGTNGTIARTTDGVHWLLVAPSGSLTSLLSVSCPSISTCFAVDNRGVLATTNGGTTWQQVYADGFVTHVVCATTSICFATAWFPSITSSYIVRTTDGGATWTKIFNGNNPLVSPTCADATNCFLTDSSTPNQVFSASTDAGATWSARGLFTGLGSINGIACPTATSCFVTSTVTPGRIYESVDGGAHWALSFDLATDPQAGSTEVFGPISCASANVCSAVGFALAATTTDGGATWRTDAVEAGNASLSAVSCPSDDTCFATTNRGTILRATDYGGSWLAQLGGRDILFGAGGGGANFTSISCPSTTACYAVGYNGVISVTTNGGVGWSKVQPSGQVTELTSISCPDANDCYAGAFGFIASSGIQVTHDGGATWSYHNLNKADIIESISCPAVNACVAVGWPGAIYTTNDGGVTWNSSAPGPANPVLGTDTSLLAINCPSSTTCYAVGFGGIVLSTVDGVNWYRETAVTGLTLRGVSCVTTTNCVAVGSGGVTLTRTSSGWTKHFTADSGTLDAVSCPGAAKCYAVGANGKLVTSGDFGLTWAVQSSGVTNTLFGIQCTSFTSCLAVGTGGTIIYTLDGAGWSRTSAATFDLFRGVAFLSPGIAYVVGAGGTILKNPNLFFLCLTTNVSSNKASPQFVGTAITFTVTAPGGCNARFEFWLLRPGGSWELIQSYSTSNTFVWNTAGLPAGTYSIGAWSKDVNSPLAFDSYAPLQFVINTMACTGAGLAAVPSSPVLAGNPVTLTATSSVCPNPQYELWMRPATSSTWQVVHPYSTTASFQWTSTVTSYFGLWAKDASSSTSTFDANAAITVTVTQPSCQSVSATAMPNGFLAGSGTHSTIFASPSNCTNPSPLFEYWMRPASSTSWTQLTNFISSSQFDWNSTGFSVGTYYFGVWVKDANSTTATFDANALTTVTLMAPACLSVSASASSSTVGHAFGDHVVITATASPSPSCLNPVYEFWVRPATSSTWTLVQPYSVGGGTFDWHTDGKAPGTYYIGVWVKDTASTTTNFDGNTLVTVTVT